MRSDGWLSIIGDREAHRLEKRSTILEMGKEGQVSLIWPAGRYDVRTTAVNHGPGWSGETYPEAERLFGMLDIALFSSPGSDIYRDGVMTADPEPADSVTVRMRRAAVRIDLAQPLGIKLERAASAAVSLEWRGLRLVWRDKGKRREHGGRTYKSFALAERFYADLQESLFLGGPEDAYAPDHERWTPRGEDEAAERELDALIEDARPKGRRLSAIRGIKLV